MLICIPTYNERDNLGLIVPAVLEQLPRCHILVIDDGSPDGTADVANALASADPRVHVLHRAAKEGLAKAYLAGFAWAFERHYTKIFEFDADFSHDPKYLPKLVELLDHYDVVVGSRRIRGGGVQDWGLGRRFVSWGGSLYARTLLSVPVRDLTGGFNGFRRDVLQDVVAKGISCTGYAFQIELKYKCLQLGYRLIESPIVFADRTRGISKMDRGIMKEAIIQVLRMRRQPNSPR